VSAIRNKGAVRCAQVQSHELWLGSRGMEDRRMELCWKKRTRFGNCTAAVAVVIAHREQNRIHRIRWSSGNGRRQRNERAAILRTARAIAGTGGFRDRGRLFAFGQMVVSHRSRCASACWQNMDVVAATGCHKSGRNQPQQRRQGGLWDAPTGKKGASCQHREPSSVKLWTQSGYLKANDTYR
jgi:hypothetical protein